MDEIVHAFGIDGRLIVIQIFNFALLAAALWYFLYTPVMKMLEEREAKIAKGVSDAEAAEKMLDDADEEKKKILSQAHKEAEGVNERAKVAADEKGVSIVKAAESKADEILKSAAMKGEEIADRARKESEAEVAKLAILAAERVLKERA